MAKNINVLLSLKDQFTSPLQKVSKNVTTMDRHLKMASNRVKAFGNSIKKGMKTVAKWGAIGFGALTAAATVFAKQSIDAAKDQVRIEKLLETTMKRASNASKEQIQAIKDEASALQNVGVVGDEVALAGANQLAVYGLRSDQIKKLMPNLNDMIAKEKGLNGTQEDAIAMADVIGKAMNGKTKGLLKYGVSLTAAEEKLFKTMKQEQRMEFISKKLTTSIGGTNKALRETDEGKIVAAKNAWGDMKEEVGKKLLPYLGKFAEWFETKIPSIQNFILGIADKIQELVVKAEPYITQIKDMFGKIFEKVKPALDETWQILSDAGDVVIDIAQGIINNWDRISPIVYTVVGAIAAYKTIVLIQATATTIAAVATKTKLVWDNLQLLMTGKLTLAQFKLNTAMSLNPIGILIGGIVALVGVGWLLYRNWDLVKSKVSELWKKLDNNPLGRVIKWFLKFGTPIGWIVRSVIYLYKNFDTLKAKAIKLWEGLKANTIELVSKAFEWFEEKINMLKQAFSRIKEKVLDFYDTLKNWFMPILEAIANPIETAKKAIGNLIDKLKFWNKQEVEDKTINITENTLKNTKALSNDNNVVSEKAKTNKTKPSRHALGTSYFKGGVTGINEGGRNETAILPAGTKILSHEEGKTLEEKNNTEKQVIIKEVENKRSSDKKIEVHIHIGGNFVGEREHMEKYAEYTCKKVIAAVNNI